VGKPGTATIRVGSEGLGAETDGGGLICGGGPTCVGVVAGGGVLDPMTGVIGAGSTGAVTVGGGPGCGKLPTRIGGTERVADGIGGGGALLDTGNGGAAGAPTWAATGSVENGNVI
jgi:hypothetical protein